MLYCCECRGPCRRVIDLPLETYAKLRLMGTVLTPECAEREGRAVLHRHSAVAVVALSIGPRVRPPRSL